MWLVVNCDKSWKVQINFFVLEGHPNVCIITGRALELSQYYRKLFDWPPSQYVTTHDPDALTRHIIVTAADYTHAL